MNKLKAALLGILFASGCQTLSGEKPKLTSAGAGGEVAPISLGEGEKALTQIAEPRLPDKSCGMLLWTLESQRPVAIFRYVNGGNGEISISGRRVVLTLGEFSGAADFGVFERQVFVSEEGVTVETESKFGRGFDGGTYLERGLIKVRDESGWSIIAPAAGVAGCRN